MNTELLLVVLLVAAATAWDTEYDAPFTYECANGQVLNRIESVHDNNREDRVFDFTCVSSPYNRALKDCQWSDYVNDFDGLLNYQCQGDKIMTGLSSYHDNNREDRRYNIKCCAVTGVIFHACRDTNWENQYDKPMDYEVPEYYSMKGMTSTHSNSHEDRIFKFVECKYMNTQ